MSNDPKSTSLLRRYCSALRITRDGAIVTVALGMAIFEIVLGGGRASVLAFLSSLLLSPVVMRVDQARRKGADE